MSDASLPAALGLPGVAGALLAIQMRNLDALTRAQRAAIEGLGTLTRQQQAILVTTLRGLAATAPRLRDPRAAVAAPIDAAKGALLDDTANANLLAELAARSGATVAGILQDRMVAALDELKAALLQAMPRART